MSDFNAWYVSLLKSKSGFLINSKTGISFLYWNPKTDYWSKWSTTEVDFFHHIQNWIVWIHDTSGSEKSEYSIRYFETVWQHCLSLRPFFNSGHGLNDRFYLFHRDGKIATQTGLHCSNSHWDKSRQNSCYTTSPVHLAVFGLISSRYLISRLILLARLKQSVILGWAIKLSRIQRKISNFAILPAAVLFFLQDTVDIYPQGINNRCGHSVYS